MEEGKLIDGFIDFGLTRQEATVYLSLYKNGTMTGYEVSKDTGISRSNAYKALSALVDKGAAYKKEGKTQKYASLGVDEVCGNKIRYLETIRSYLEKNMPLEREEQEGYLTIVGDRHILDKMTNMLKNAHKRVYISMSAEILSQMMEELKALIAAKKKVVILTDKNVPLDTATIYITKRREDQVGIITDSEYVLTGQYGQGADSTCLYSDQKNFVQVFKDSMANEIKLLEIEENR